MEEKILKIFRVRGDKYGGSFHIGYRERSRYVEAQLFAGQINHPLEEE